MIFTKPLIDRLSGLRSKAQAAKGLSLLEMAMVMLVVSVSLMPLMQTLNGVRGSNGEGPADRITAYKSKEALMANTLIEQALAGNYNNILCNSGVTFNPTTDVPEGKMVTFNRCANTTYNKTMYYEWTIYSVPKLPAQNQYYRASLNVFNVPSGGTSILTLQSNFFYNSGAYSTGNNLTGIMLAMDISGSMTSAKNEDGSLPVIDGMASPYMFYRYDRYLFEGTTYGSGSSKLLFPVNSVPGHVTPGAIGKEVILNMWNNAQLDLSFAGAVKSSPTNIPDFSDPTPATPYNEKFPYSRTNNPPLYPQDPTWGEGVLGIGDCGDTDGSGQPPDNNWDGTDRNNVYTFLPSARKDKISFGNYPARTVINQLCQPKESNADLLNSLNIYMSRIEAARTGALTMLLNLESNPAITSTLEVGYIPWNGSPDTSHLITPEAPITIPQATGIHFVASRNKFLWINRADPSNINSPKPVNASGSTNINLGLEAARTQLMAKNYSRRVIVLLTDGYPNPNSGANSTTSLKSYSLNTIGKNAPDNQQITLFTVGLIAADKDLLDTMATNTPAGQSYTATDLSQVSGIFESIAYQIQKLALLNAVKRYGLSL
jgi:hypothetical protein